MKHIIVLISLAALALVAWSAEAEPVETELVGCSAEPGGGQGLSLDGFHARPDGCSPGTGKFWEPLEQMSPAERANAEIWLEPGTEALAGARDEARAIGRLWNSGSFDEALERMRGLYRFADPRRVTVAFSWRTPVETEPETDWGPDIRIGSRDSMFGCMFDRSANGYLFASFPRRGLSQTFIFNYRSTDNGSTWYEMSGVYWGVVDFLEAWSAACHGGYYQVSWVNGVPANRCWAGRVSTTTGQWVLFPGDSLAVIPFESASGDSFRQLAVCTAEDVSAGGRIYLFGRTKNRLLYYAYTDSSCRAWRLHSTGVNYCDNGLDCTYNEGGDSNYLWVSWVRNYDNDSAKLGFGWRSIGDTLFHRSWFSNVYSVPGIHIVPTAVTAYHDTILFGFLQQGSRQVREVYSYAGGGRWYQAALSDSGDYRDQVEVAGRRGGGFAVGYRHYGPEEYRYVMFRHADNVRGPYSEPDTVSEHRPLPISRIRIENLGSGQYGVVWVNWDDRTYRAAWFDRVSLTGIEEPERPGPVPLGLQALACRSGVRLAFDNPATGQVRVRVFNLTGRLMSAREEQLPAGRQEIDLKPEASGVYFAMVEAAGEHASTRFAFAR